MFDFIFNGKERINRLQYLGICVATMFVALVMLAIMGAGNGFFAFFAVIALLINSVVGICAAVYRLHDLGHTGWMYLIVAIPFVGFLFAIYMLFAAGQAGANQYGDQP